MRFAPDPIDTAWFALQRLVGCPSFTAIRSTAPEVPEIAGARITWTAVAIQEITTGDHSKRPDSRERPGL